MNVYIGTYACIGCEYDHCPKNLEATNFYFGLGSSCGVQANQTQATFHPKILLLDLHESH